MRVSRLQRLGRNFRSALSRIRSLIYSWGAHTKDLHSIPPISSINAGMVNRTRISSRLRLPVPRQNRVNNARTYERYLGLLQTLRQDVRFPTVHASINRKMGYPVSALRAIEVVMFLNAPRVGFNASAEQ